VPTQQVTTIKTDLHVIVEWYKIPNCKQGKQTTTLLSKAKDVYWVHNHIQKNHNSNLYWLSVIQFFTTIRQQINRLERIRVLGMKTDNTFLCKKFTHSRSCWTFHLAHFDKIKITYSYVMTKTCKRWNWSEQSCCKLRRVTARSSDREIKKGKNSNPRLVKSCLLRSAGK